MSDATNPAPQGGPALDLRERVELEVSFAFSAGMEFASRRASDVDIHGHPYDNDWAQGRKAEITNRILALLPAPAVEEGGLRAEVLRAVDQLTDAREHLNSGPAYIAVVAAHDILRDALTSPVSPAPSQAESEGENGGDRG